MPADSNPLSTKLRPFGETIFAEMTRLAQKHDAINLGQGFPDFEGPPGIIASGGILQFCM